MENKDWRSSAKGAIQKRCDRLPRPVFQRLGDPLDAPVTLAFDSDTPTEGGFLARGDYNRIEALADLHAAEVQFIDAARLTSDVLTILISAPEQLDSGSACSDAELWSVCGDGTLCVTENDEGICQDVPLACPADWMVTD